MSTSVLLNTVHAMRHVTREMIAARMPSQLAVFVSYFTIIIRTMQYEALNSVYTYFINPYRSCKCLLAITLTSDI